MFETIESLILNGLAQAAMYTPPGLTGNEVINRPSKKASLIKTSFCAYPIKPFSAT
jgi:hypothetical protein